MKHFLISEEMEKAIVKRETIDREQAETNRCSLRIILRDKMLIFPPHLSISLTPLRHLWLPPLGNLGPAERGRDGLEAWRAGGEVLGEHEAAQDTALRGYCLEADPSC